MNKSSISRDWPSLWGLERNPFREAASEFIALASREMALRRLLAAIGDGEPVVSLRGEAGMGKSAILREASARLKGPSVHVLHARCPSELPTLVIALAEGLGIRTNGQADPFRALARGVKVRRGLGEHLVFLIDDAQHLAEEAWGPFDTIGQAGGVTVVRGLRDEGPRLVRDWSHSWRLPPLSYSESRDYLDSKLARAGCRSRVFGPEAIGRLHAWSEGTPRGLDRLATLTLRAAAERGETEAPATLIDDLATKEFELAG